MAATSLKQAETMMERRDWDALQQLKNEARVSYCLPLALTAKVTYVSNQSLVCARAAVVLLLVAGDGRRFQD